MLAFTLGTIRLHPVRVTGPRTSASSQRGHAWIPLDHLAAERPMLLEIHLAQSGILHVVATQAGS